MSYAGTYGSDETCEHGSYYRSCCGRSWGHMRTEVERLREERDTEAGIRIRAVEQMVRYREAIEPFAHVATLVHLDHLNDDTELIVRRRNGTYRSTGLTLYDCRNARAVLDGEDG